MSVLIALMLMATAVIVLKMDAARRTNANVPSVFASQSYLALPMEWILARDRGRCCLDLPDQNPRFAFDPDVVDVPRWFLGGHQPAFASLIRQYPRRRTSLS